MNIDALNQSFVRLFRNSSPYINAHKERTFVIAIDGEAIDRPDFASIVQDFALLSSLGVRLVLIHGARPQLDAKLRAAGKKTAFSGDRRITDLETLQMLTEVCGHLRSRIESQLSMGLANSPMQGARIRVCSGNFVTARPEGVLDSIDLQHTGRVRRIDVRGITGQLDAGSIVLLAPLGYSPTGEIFSLGREELALAVASALQAHKLILLRNHVPVDDDGDCIRELTVDEAQRGGNKELEIAVEACESGVERCHILDFSQDGALLQELFTRDGVGTMIKRAPFETIRQAGIEDVGGIVELLAPLERDGILVRRSRELLEMEIDHFYVAERDSGIIACAALYPTHSQAIGEIACVATHADYQRAGRGERLLDHLEGLAKQQGLERLFVLSTVSGHWFREHGYEAAELEALPTQRRHLYNYQRNSKVYLKQM